ncbi:E3 ubiquitin-protein ligase RNF182 [Dunckerocampus dactyliophorus]|uniref:E3 ubiquitin-protein ligase RNF182 n=1 Tax=Dunckerocampus dactyliophorus TaxID=161453 RepID=UPI00240650F0|nr:E3 ubiquitin-protein ligase RNF182 [Dunckerocampus dactyliophorus]
MIDVKTTQDISSHEAELECKICYCAYNLGGRRPKVLECCHRLCAKCLAKIQDLRESPPSTVVCPFCRYVTTLMEEAPSSLPDDCNLVAILALQSKNHRNLQYHQETTTELLLDPRNLSSLRGGDPSAYSSIRGSPNFVVITIMEPPPPPSLSQDPPHQPCGPHATNRSSSQDSMASIAHRWTLWNCAALLCQTSVRALVWMLGLLYFSSLPMGVYLLIMQQTTMGVLLVTLVPASLVMIMVYGFCQCVCQEVWKCMPS